MGTDILALLKAGESKRNIVTQLVRGGMNLEEAVKAYTEVARDNGFILSAEEKAKILAEVYDEYYEAYQKNGVWDRENAVKAYMDKAHVSKATATNKLKQLADADGVEWPRAATRNSRDHDAIAAVVKKWHEDGAPEGSIKAGLMQHYNYTEKGVDAAYRKYGKMAGFLGRDSGARRQVSEFFARHTKTGRKEWIDAMVQEMGCQPATAQTRYAIWLQTSDFMQYMEETAGEDEDTE